MKTAVKIIDTLGFILFGAAAALFISAAAAVGSLSGKRRFPGREINRFSFVIADFIDQKYPSMREDILLNGYISRDYSVYLNFNSGADRSKTIADRIFAYSISAHPDNAVYRAGFKKMNMLMVELKILARAFMAIRGKRITFLKAHDPHLLGLNGIIISRIFGLPCAMHLNSDFEMKYRGIGKTAHSVFPSRALERIFESWVMGRYDIIMADREFYRSSRFFPARCACRYRAFGVRVDGVHYSDPKTRRDPRERLNLKGKRLIICVGRLNRVKYPEEALKAFKVISSAVGDAVLLMAGSGGLEGALRGMAQELGIGDKIIFLGTKSQAELADILSASDLMLAPHGGVTLLEASLAAIPVVAYDFDWHSEFLRNGSMGYIVPFKDTGAMAEKAVEVLKDERLRKKMGQYSREIAVSQYSRTRSLDNERAIYEEIVKR